MIIVNFNGGLGNQMSQYAMMVKLQKMYPNVKVRARLDEYRIYDMHNGLELDKIFPCIKADLREGSGVDKLKCCNDYGYAKNQKIGFVTKVGRKVTNVGWKGLQKLHIVKSATTIEQVYKSGYPEQKEIYKLDDNKDYYLYGTWHNYDYSDVLDILRKHFTFVEDYSELTKKYLAMIHETEAVSIHVRRGDYVGTDIDSYNIEYYKNAVERVRSKVKSPVFYIFSDNIEAIKKDFDFLKDSQVVFVEGNSGKDSYQDMLLMKECKHNIIANSTFSYWAAMLNDYEGKVVIRPLWQTLDRKTWEVDGWIII